MCTQDAFQDAQVANVKELVDFCHVNIQPNSENFNTTLNGNKFGCSTDMPL